MKRLTHFSLCSGIGGLDLAAEWAGFETVGQCEIDKYASCVLAKNFEGVKNYGDIRTITAERLAGDGVGDITVLSAGIPCQPYSLAGKGLGDCDSRDLEQELVRVVGEVRPKWLVVENTPGLFARKNQRYFDRIVNDISALGYGVAWGLWGACDVGAPHRRERVFIVCRNTDSDDETEKQAIQKRENAQSCGNSRIGNSNRNVSDAVGERRGTNEIQRGKSKESRNEKNGRGIQESGLQSKRVCVGVSHSASNVMGMFGGTGETEATGARRSNYGNRAQEYGSREWWQAEPGLDRVANGVPGRVDRLRCLGNAVVPYQAYPIFKAIAKIERGEL